MDKFTYKAMKKIKNNIDNNTRTIIVEGAADKSIYKRFYPDAEFIYGNGANSVVEKIRQCNDQFGKTPLVVAIIDKDIMMDEEMKLLLTENIYTLNTREIESIFLREDIIRRLFGEEFFRNFSERVKIDASTRVLESVESYQGALKILKNKISSKYNIRLLLKEANIRNMGNNKNIEYLCRMMDETLSWELVEDLIPKLERIKYWTK